MCNEKLFYLKYFHIRNFDLTFFKEEILLIFGNKHPLYRCNFHVNTVYIIHLFLPNGRIIGKVPFKLLSVKDDEDLIEDIYFDLYVYLDKYLKSIQHEDTYMEFSPYKHIF